MSRVSLIFCHHHRRRRSIVEKCCTSTSNTCAKKGEFRMLSQCRSDELKKLNCFITNRRSYYIFIDNELL